MPFLALFTWLASFFGRDAKNLGFNIAKLSAWSFYVIAIISVFLASIFTLLDSVAVAVPTLATDVWGWFMPSNAAGCLIVIISARILRAILDYKISMATKRLQMLRSSS